MFCLWTMELWRNLHSHTWMRVNSTLQYIIVSSISVSSFIIYHLKPSLWFLHCIFIGRNLETSWQNLAVRVTNFTISSYKTWGMIKISVTNIPHIAPRVKQMYSSTYFGNPHHLFSMFYKASECLETSVRLHWDKAHLGLFSFLVVVLKWS